MLAPGQGTPGFELRVFDEHGQLISGRPEPPSQFSGRASFSALFYPEDDIGPRMAAALPERRWTLTLSPNERNAPVAFAAVETQGYWLSGLSVLLMCLALALVVHGQKQSAQLARMQSDFVSHVSHQLKTPLAVLSATTETLSLDRVRSPEKLAQYLGILRNETARLTALVSRILEYSRVEGRNKPYELEEVDLGDLARETLEALRPALEKDGATAMIDVTAPAPMVVADPAALEQALVNLIDNAVKYSPGRKQVTVRVRSAGNEAILEVADRGRGIEPGERVRIFERFFRGSGASANPNGFGLGLAIVQEICRGHRGRIEVESNHGAGSIFRITLPRRDRLAGSPEPAPLMSRQTLRGE